MDAADAMALVQNVDTARLAAVAEVARRYLPDFLAGRRADADLYAPGVTSWQNIGEVETELADVPSASRARRTLPDLKPTDVRVFVHDRGFVVQSVTVGNGVRVPSCLLVTVSDGRITRFEQYADSAAAQQLLAAASD